MIISQLAVLVVVSVIIVSPLAFMLGYMVKIKERGF